MSTVSGWRSRRCNLDDVEEGLGGGFVAQAGGPRSCTFTADQQWKHCSFFSVETHGLPRPRLPKDSGRLTAWWLAGTHGAAHTGEASGCVLEMLRSRGKESKGSF